MSQKLSVRHRSLRSRTAAAMLCIMAMGTCGLLWMTRTQSMERLPDYRTAPRLKARRTAKPDDFGREGGSWFALGRNGRGETSDRFSTDPGHMEKAAWS